jgi:hypothetical protein
MLLSYSDLILLKTFEERLDYLRTDGLPSEVTFAALRPLNQRFYSSANWKRVRRAVIARDLAYDLAVPGRHITGRVIVHHMNPLRPKDIYYNSELALNPDYLVTVSHDTHQGIHFGYTPPEPYKERAPGDTRLW